MKGVFADYQAWNGDRRFVDRIVSARGAAVQINLFWPEWQPQRRARSQCWGGRAVWFEGGCFIVPVDLDATVQAFSSVGIRVSGVVIGTPRWAVRSACRRPTAADPSAFDPWCPPRPEALADFRRFVRFMARRYGRPATGRIADFIVGNEVNTAGYWNDANCVNAGDGKRRCDAEAWIDGYARLFTTAYDAIHAEQASARVLVSLGNGFFAPYETVDTVTAAPAIAGTRFLTGLAARVGKRRWLVAIHPYSTPLGAPEFSLQDYQPGRRDQTERGRVTFGNVGAVSGWLWANFPSSAAARNVYLTEQGFSSINFGSDETAQADALCRSFRNALGTPGVVRYVYHRLIDHAAEIKEGGTAFGLWANATVPKAAWTTWASADDPSAPRCGYDDLPYTRLQRSREGRSGRHWTSSRLPPAGYTGEVSQTWRLLRDPSARARREMTLLFECGVTQSDGSLTNTMITADPRCRRRGAAPDLPLGPVGYGFRRPGVGRVPLYSCESSDRADHFVSARSDCEGATRLEFLGYAAR